MALRCLPVGSTVPMERPEPLVIGDKMVTRVITGDMAEVTEDEEEMVVLEEQAVPGKEEMMRLKPAIS